MKNSLLNRFVPKESKFFPLLNQLSQTVLNASELLIDSMNHDTPETWQEYYHKVKEAERKGDQITQQIFMELGQTFITPFDREDIHDLAFSIDDVTDRIHSASKRIAIYKPHAISDSGKELAVLIQQGASIICKAMDELETFSKNPSRLKDYCQKLHEIENHADEAYDLFIMQLFNEETDCIELIKTKEIMQELEKTTGRNVYDIINEEIASAPPLRNDAALTNRMADLAGALFGEKLVYRLDEGGMGSEDFASYTYDLPCAYLLIGAGTKQENPAFGEPMHNERVVFNEDILPRGAALHTWCALNWLADEGNA